MMKKSPVRLYDAHAHLGSETEWRERTDREIPSFISFGTPTEAAAAEALLDDPAVRPLLLPTYGLHPWHTAEYSVDEMMPFLEKCSVIGEIGMDSVWCGVSPDIQERAFRDQLSVAAKLRKPAVLHTKGQEAEIAEILKDYKNTYLVHWYSCSEHLEQYLTQDCYFSIGPDVGWNKATARTASLVPIDRLLIETDGMNAVKWAFNASPPPELTPPACVEDVLTSVLYNVASLRGLTPDRLQRILEDNFLRFCGQAGISL